MMTQRDSIPIGVVVGQVNTTTKAGMWTVALAELAGSAETAIANPIPALEVAGRATATHFGETLHA